jgi:hypothetical protein
MVKVLDITKELIVEFLELDKSWDVEGMKRETLRLFALDVVAKLEELGYRKTLELTTKTTVLVRDVEPKYLGLTKEQFEQLLPCLNKHVRAWGGKAMIEQHSLYNIEKAYWVEEEKCFHVHYMATDEHTKVWYHYNPVNGTWW